jgi:hypothetical protein
MEWLLLLALVTNTGCTLGNRLAGYTYKRPPCVVDPRGVPVEPCCDCNPMAPGCGDTDACQQCRRTRETFFDSMYAFVCECNLWPNSDCCDRCEQ